MHVDNSQILSSVNVIFAESAHRVQNKSNYNQEESNETTDVTDCYKEDVEAEPLRYAIFGIKDFV